MALFFRSLASIARAHSEWLPPTALQAYEYGLVESLPERTPSTRNSTRRIPEASLAVAVKVISCPRVAVVFAAGVVRATAGGVVSAGGVPSAKGRARGVWAGGVVGSGG